MNPRTKSGVELIAIEREEQLLKHKKSLKHDKQYKKGELAYHAAILATPIILYQKEDYANTTRFYKAEQHEDWKLPNMAYKKESNIIIDNNTLSKEERIKQLVVAGALIAAEIDRIQLIGY